jgi:serine/threonine protein phosphatase PrpC
VPSAIVTAFSHIGAVRDINQDSIVVGAWTLCANVTPQPQRFSMELGEPLVVAVADGLGGHAGGEVASSLVVRDLAALGARLRSSGDVEKALRQVDLNTYAAAAAQPELRGMGTTVAGVLLHGDMSVPFNIGDSRTYRWRSGDSGVLEQVSTDDSPPLFPGQRSTHIVTQTLGGSFHPEPIHPHVGPGEPIGRDAFLICSDGLTDLVADDEISEALHIAQLAPAAGALDADATAIRTLWSAAMAAGGIDNISIVIARLDPAEHQSPP